MKKIILTLALAILSAGVFSQDLETIIKKHEKAIGKAASDNYKTMKVVGVLEQGGMTINITIYEKKPGKLRQETSVNGMDMITVINGDKGYMINPMMGSAEPTPLDAATIESSLNNSVIGSSLGKNLKEGKLELVGDAEIDGKAAYKLKVAQQSGDMYVFIDKKEFLVLSTEMELSQMGQTFTTVMKMTDYRTVNGAKFAHKILTSTMGMEGVMQFVKVEVDVPLADSLFEVK